MPLHLIKLCVGVDSVDELAAWRAEQKRNGRACIVRTRSTPKRAEEVLAGGSLFWVIKRQVRCRQLITAVRTIEDGARTRCELTLADSLVLVEPRGKKPFQGWRYLEHREAPLDLDAGIAADLPNELAAELRALGLW
ncbi:MAG: DUF1489 domain-containing protein [Pseudomonadota bacterium]|nr:DUF1489 domain-containing protein [Pseudomonadota bacterium]